MVPVVSVTLYYPPASLPSTPVPVASAEFYPASSGVINMDSAGYEAMMASEEPYFVEFYAPWCPHCQGLKSDWSQVAKTLTNKVKVAAVDCTAEASGECSPIATAGLQRHVLA